MRELPAGQDAVVLDFSSDATPSRSVLAAADLLRASISAGRLRDITDLIPSAHTLLVQSGPGTGIDILGIHRALRAQGNNASGGSADESGSTVEIPVVYDGEDVDEVARMLGVAADEVRRLHRSTVWRVQFMGFAPGFGYLVPDSEEAGANPFASVGRRLEPRTAVPHGAVAIAAGYSAVYPRQSPGGWQLLGHTTIPLWDEHATPPALLAPGTIVRFVDDSSDGHEPT